jgi:hypothetical protein
MIKWATSVAVTMLFAALAGCSATIDDHPLNPSFPVTFAAADAVLADAAAHPRPLRRPLLIVGGFADPGLGSRLLRDRFRGWTGDDRVIDVSLCYDNSFDDCRRDIVAAVDSAYPTADPDRTTEVDVIGASMGGLAARYAAIRFDGTIGGPSVGPTPRRRLRIGRLFTIGSPLRGAILADRIPLNLHPLQPGMRTGSWVYRRIEAATPSWDDLYPIYSYVRLNDDQVGPENAAVPGATPWWLSAPAWPRPTHHASFLDHRILADIALRLRGEAPLSHDPPTPLPPEAW